MKKILAVLLLLITTFFWGITFTIVKEAVTRVDVFVFLAQRFFLAFTLLLGLCLIRRRPLSRATLMDGIVLGIFLFSAFAFQTVALVYTTASNTGFLTGLNVLFVPLIGALFFRQPVSGGVTAGVLLAVSGLFLLCTNGSTWQFNQGDILASICAICVALHLLLTSRFARRGECDIFWLTTLQIGTVFLLSLCGALWRGQPVFAYHPEINGALFACAIFATVFAFLVQTAMQRFISPSHTALIFCTEPVFAAICAFCAADERLGRYSLLGAGLILAGMLVSELLPGRVTGALSLAAEQARD
jgi:drug/metabolite transporter (DMT)-like permease